MFTAVATAVAVAVTVTVVVVAVAVAIAVGVEAVAAVAVKTAAGGSSSSSSSRVLSRGSWRIPLSATRGTCSPIQPAIHSVRMVLKKLAPAEPQYIAGRYNGDLDCRLQGRCMVSNSDVVT